MERCVVVFSANDKVNVRNQLHIPNDLFFSILSKLPIKSLKRFGCVRKSWSLLFDNPIFMTMYHNHLLTKDHSYYDNTSVFLHQTFIPWESYYCYETFELYCVSGERFENRVKLDWPSVKLDPINRIKIEYDSGFNILGSGSVNGTLCLFCASQQNIILWKPSTKEFKLIPPSPFDNDWGILVEHRGFGYDRVRDDYKVLCYGQLIPDFNVQSRDDIPSNRYIWEIYSLKSNCWRILDDVNKDHWPSICTEQVYKDGFSHCTCTSKSETHNDKYMLSIDWSNEIFLTTPIPSYIDDDSQSFPVWPYLTLLNGSIALILHYTKINTFHISILGELGVQESWTKMFIVGPLPCFDTFIGSGKKGIILFRKTDGRLVLFDLNTQTIEELDIISYRCCCKIVIHKENLLPFEGTNI